MLVDELKAARRAENRSAGRRLAVVGEVDSCRLRQLGGRETWCTDTQEAVAAEEAAALRVGQALATSHLYYARAMRTRLPLVGALLRDHNIRPVNADAPPRRNHQTLLPDPHGTRCDSIG